MYGKILISVDGSDSNKVAVDDGLKLAKEMGSEVTALYVFDMGEYLNPVYAPSLPNEKHIRESSEMVLNYVIDQANSMGVKLRTKVSMGNPASVIIEETKKYDLLVCGTLGKTGLSRALMGSVAERVVRYSNCPVLVSRNPTK